jgi:hypothetical protein
MEIGSKKREFTEWRPSLNLKPARVVHYELKPASRFVAKWVVLGGTKGSPAFNDDGVYKLRALFLVGDPKREGWQSVRTETEDLHVEKPTKRVDKVAWKFLKDIKKAYFTLMQAPWRFGDKSELTRKARERLQKIAVNHKDSVYTPYLFFGLGRHYKYLAQHAAAKATKDPEKAQAYRRQEHEYKGKALASLKKAKEIASDNMFQEWIRAELLEVYKSINHDSN